MLERARFHVREATRLQAQRPALLLGLRTSLATMMPLVLAPWIGESAATWASLGGFGVSLVDKGGAYRTRAESTGAVALGGALAVALGSLVSRSFPLALVVVLVVTTACMFAGALGAAGTSIGNSIAVQLAVAVSLPSSPGDAVARGLAFLAGGGAAMLIAVVLWPVRVYAPVRRAAAIALRAVAAHARELGARADVASPAWKRELSRGHRSMRDAVETARAALAATRRGRRGESGRGARLLVVVQLVEREMGTLLALEDVIETRGGRPADALARLAGALDDLADAVVIEASRPAIEAPAPAAARGDDDVLDRLLARAWTDVTRAAQMIANLGDDRSVVPPIDPAPAPSTASRWGEVLRAAVDPDAVIFRHALRVGVTATIAVALARVLGVAHGYFISLTALLLLQPYLPATVIKGMQRLGGTVLGGIIAAVLVTVLRDPDLLMVAVAVLAAASAAVLQLNYGLYAMFLTPTFVLLADVHTVDAELVRVRIVNTLIGGALAVAAALSLWPTRERARLPDQVARAVDAVRAYFGGAIAEPPLDHAALAALRRESGLRIGNAELSFERVLAEAALTPQQQEAWMTVLLYTRRAGTALTSWATLGAPRAEPAEIAAVDAAFASVAEAIRRGGQPAPFVPPASLPRVGEMLATVADAVARAHA